MAADDEGVPVQLERVEVTEEGLQVTGVWNPPAWAAHALAAVSESGRPLYSLARSLGEQEGRPRRPRVAGVVLALEQLPTEQPAALATLTPAGWSYWTLDDWGHGLLWTEADAGDLQWSGTPDELVEFVNRHVRPEQLRVFGG